MARPRSELSAILHGICENVYFQPPASKKIVYPCIVYKLNNLNETHADNGTYRMMDEYNITYITRDPDDANIREIGKLQYCAMTNAQSSDNLHNYNYRLYF